VLAILAGAVAALRPAASNMIFGTPWTGLGFAEIAPVTAWAAVKVWTFWTLAAAVVAAVLLRVEPRLGRVDAVLGGFCGVWIFAWIGGSLLGPIGLWRTWSIWTLLVVGLVWLARSWSRPVWRPLSPGGRLTVLTTVLIVPTVLLLQLGSPVPPFMDILATPAAAQRIITFGWYAPFDNDPYGYWNPSAQLPALELFYALLGIGSATSLGLLADSAAIVPMVCLLILSTYRFGRTLGGDLLGGMATLFLTATILIRVTPFMHGRATSFVLLAVGLAFFLDERKNATRLVLAGLAFGTAVASHAVMGTLAMLVASVAVLGWFASGGVGAGLRGVGVLAGASLIGAPTVPIALATPVPYPVLPALQLAGIVLLVWSARGLHDRTLPDLPAWLVWPLTLAVIVILLWQPRPFMPNNHQGRFPLLVYGGGVGLALMLVLAVEGRAARGRVEAALGPVTIALVIGIAIEQLSSRWHTSFSDPALQMAVHEWFYKIDYWYPWLLVFPTAFLAAWISRRISRRLALFAALAILSVPWRDRIDPDATPEKPGNPDYHQHSISEAWAYQLETAKRGYWVNSRDRRWAQSADALEMIDLLRAEIAAGRITRETRIVHLAPKIILFKDNLLFAVYTGINADTYVHPDHVIDRSIAGGRIRPMAEVHARLATRPEYVAIHGEPVTLAPGELEGYTELFNKGGIRLYRR
jgi:hypothetical protein